MAKKSLGREVKAIFNKALKEFNKKGKVDHVIILIGSRGSASILVDGEASDPYRVKEIATFIELFGADRLVEVDTASHTIITSLGTEVQSVLVVVGLEKIKGDLKKFAIVRPYAISGNNITWSPAMILTEKDPLFDLMSKRSDLAKNWRNN
jgi:hypothetical protein